MIVPVYNVQDWVDQTLESITSQSLRDLEIIVVDDGSTDRSIDIVRRHAERDDRIRIIHQENAGLGAARNTGARYATGEFIAFADSDDLVMPGAFEAMVAQLRCSGSDFVTGAFARGDETDARKPHWVARAMGRDRTGLTIEDEPTLLLDITAWNKVFRRSFWTRHDFSFVEGVRYEDQVPITRAYLTAKSFDVLRQRVYLWRTRMDGTSITQQKTSIRDLQDRLRSQEGCAALMQRASARIREAWYEKLLGYDLPNYLLAAMHANASYVDLLQTRLERLREEVPPHVWSRVAFRNRAKSWLVSHGRMDLAIELRAWFEQHTGGLPMQVHDGRMEYALPPLDLDASELPDWLRTVADVDVHPTVRLTETRWEGTTLILRGSAYLFPLPSDEFTHHLRLRLVADDGLSVDVPLTRFADVELDHLAQLDFLDVSDSGFEARIDGAHLAGAVPGGQCGLRLEFLQQQAGFERISDLTHVFNCGSGGSREPRACSGRMVRLAGVVEKGHRMLVHDTYAFLSGHRTLSDDRSELDISIPAADPVVSVGLEARNAGERTVPFTEIEPGLIRVEVSPDEGRRLWTRHASGRRVQVLWGVESNVLGGRHTGGFVHRGESQSVMVSIARPAVAITGIDDRGAALRVRGSGLGAEGHRLVLRGSRGDALASAPLPNGDFEVDVPLQQDPWGLGAAPLTPGVYDLVLMDPHGGAGDVSARDVFGPSSLRAGLPLRLTASAQHLDVVMTHLYTLQVRAEALSQRDMHPREQRRLRSEIYAAQRHEPRLPCVLLETFSGSSTGDSPRAIAQELVRRRTPLDVVWSVQDLSLPVPQGTRAVVRFSEEWYSLLARAAYVVNNANFPFFFRKAPGQVYLQTWHGTPLKRIANDIEDKRYLSLTYQRTMEREATAWDYLISPSPYCSEILPRAFRYDGAVLETGYPRNDVLVSPDASDVGRAVRRRLGIDDDRRVVLYAPTWRDAAQSGGAGFSKVLYLDPREVVEALPDTVVLIRGHANTSRANSVRGAAQDGVLDVTLYPDINELFLASDLLLTDYSSVMFDYAALDRPMMFLVPDLADYRDRLRGFYFDFEASAPGPLLGSQRELIEHLSGSPDDARFATARAEFRDRFAPWDDGRAASRVVDHVFGDTTA